MRRKNLTVALLFGMALLLTACGEKGIQRKNDRIATVTIDGDKYVLTGDFQEVVGSMVENGTDVRNERTYDIYDEEGKYSDEIIEKDNHYVLATELEYQQDWSEDTLLYSDFVIRGNQFDFESKCGITSDSDKSDLKELEGFMKTDAYANSFGNDNRLALYINGKIVDLSEYDDEYKEWIELAKKEGITTGLSASSQLGRTFYLTLRNHANPENPDIDNFIEEYDKSEYSFEKTVTLQLAVEDALQKLAEGEISTCSIVSFGTTNNEKDIFMRYVNFYYEADYDVLKFWNRKDK